jgi:ribosomal protein L11 methyltransferase
MPFKQITIDLGSADPAGYEEVLAGLGAVSVTLEDAADDPVLEPGPGETPLWGQVRLRALFDGESDLAAIMAALAELLPDGRSPSAETIEDRAWEREWLRDFRPMRFGQRLWVCPGGQPADDPGAVRIELDPGLAFGTGTHPTTALCLAWLDAHDLAGREVVDYGCGSGILAIAARRLGAASVRAVDIDAQALLATRENAERNGIRAGLVVTDETDLAPGSSDIILANILARPLIELAPRFAAALRSGGEIALSGVLLDQVDSVTAAYRPWFHIALTAARDGWALVEGRRRAD